MIKKIFCTFIIITFMFLLSSCKSENTSRLKISEYDSPYTACYKNEDSTYSIYVYAAPIQYWNGSSYELIDNDIVESNIKPYLFMNKANNIKVYFPESLNDSFLLSTDTFSLNFSINVDKEPFSKAQKQTYTNIYGQSVDAICYSSDNYSLFFYPSYSGIEMDTIFCKLPESCPEILLTYSQEDLVPEKNEQAYVLLKQRTEPDAIEAIIHHPFEVRDDGKMYPVPNVNTKSPNANETHISYDYNPNFKKINQSITLYTSNMPDSATYSKMNINQYLSRFFYLGNDNVYGKGLAYIRCRLAYYFTIDTTHIKSASYNTYIFNSQENNIYYIYKNSDQWSSTNINWNTRNMNFEKIKTQVWNNNNQLHFDITDYVKECCADHTCLTESKGLVISYGGNSQILATADNPLFIPYLEITLSELPNAFYPILDINI